MKHSSQEPTKKFTVTLPADLVHQAVILTGGSVRHAIQSSLEEMTHRMSSLAVLKMRGKIDLGIDLTALRRDE